MKVSTVIQMALAPLFVIATVPTFLPAQKVEIPLKFKNTTPLRTNSYVFTVGAHPSGSDGVDTAIGEVEIPNIPLPGGIFNVWSVIPGDDDIWLSPKEYRHLGTMPSKEIYNLNVSWSGGKLEISWPPSLQNEIDSVWITDGYSDFPQNFLAVKVTPGTTLVTENPSLLKFNVIVWYKATNVGVDEVAQSIQSFVYPNPATSAVTAVIPQTTQTITVTNVLGRELMSFTLNNATLNGDASDKTQPVVEYPLDLSTLDPGYYVVRAIGADGSMVQIPIIHE